MQLRLSIALAMLCTPCLAAAPPAGAVDPPPLPAGQAIVNRQVTFDRAAGFSRDFTFRTVGVETERAYVYPDGLISLGGRLAEDFGDESGPFDARRRPEWPIVAPLLADLGGRCENWSAEEAAEYNRIEYLVDGDDLIVMWRSMLPAEPDCGTKLAPQASTFAARLSWGETFEVTFTYERLAPGLLPRAGVMFPESAFELHPDQGKPRTDRAFALATGGSEGHPGNEDMARTWTRGVWVLAFDDGGRLVGDLDRDGARSVDNCQFDPNPDQADLDLDGVGNVCDNDLDGDTHLNRVDNCYFIANDQRDTDRDGLGDACDADDDGDGLYDHRDNCPLVANPANLDQDSDGIGDDCDADPDGDDRLATLIGHRADYDLCPHVWDPEGMDFDQDGIGDACDLAPRHPCAGGPWCAAEMDADGDGVADLEDTCPTVANPTQTDSDGDGLGNPCDWDCNGDGELDLYQPAVRVGCMVLVGRDGEIEPIPVFTPAD